MSDFAEYEELLDSSEQVEIVEEAAEEAEVVTEEPETVEAEQAEAEQAEAETETKTEEPKAEESKEQTTGSDKESWTLAAVLDEREKRQKAVAENEELRKKLAEFEKPEDDVSFFDDEAGAKAQLEQKTQSQIRNVALNLSQAFAEETFGAEKVSAATKWMETEGIKSPYVVNQFNEAKLPFHVAVKLWEEDQERQNPVLSREKLKAEILAELEQKPKEEETHEASTPSLASKRSSGTSSDVSEDYEDILGA